MCKQEGGKNKLELSVNLNIILTSGTDRTDRGQKVDHSNVCNFVAKQTTFAISQ